MLFRSHGKMDTENFLMIRDAMNAIHKCQLDQYIRNFNDSLLFSKSPEIASITKAMKYKSHSGASFAYCIRSCQYFLNNHEEWTGLCKQYAQDSYDPKTI